MMSNRAVTLVSVWAMVVAIGSWAPAEAQKARKKARPAAARKAPAPPLPCGNIVAFQVLLDRQGFSPGQIEAASTVNTTRALTAFQNARKIAASGKPDCDTWQALNGDAAEPAVIEYEITPADTKGPFTERIPARLEQQADLPALGYRSVLEKVAERFHSSPALLSSLNRGTKFAAGQRIKVPGVTPFDPDAKPERDATAGDITIQVSRADSALRAMRPDGTVVLFVPVTSGSQHDPLPTGDWKVTGVAWRPVFNYNPDLFWDANPKDKKATLKPGPNNPVGLVWIDLNIPHYGLHGTPEPGKIGTAESHGCVRLTNWDAARVAALVRPGTPVQFR